MYQHLLMNLKDDLKTFDREDCRKVRDLIRYFERNKGVPLKIILEKSYEYYEGYCKGKGLEVMTEWQFYLTRTELEW